MNIQHVTAEVAKANVNLAEAGALMSQAAREIENLRRDLRLKDREHERLINRLQELFDKDNFDDARDLVRDAFRAIHGPND